ncbi:uncharacterized protein LOC129610310 [Condylostylus longicornis]|uniref:uncharacterized protein LOC129610310 n=1 Tax=Condylostylus longicornis TaxID=2530218 RepID=UPI00244E0EFD|nr:uncharacterized protein LOC129610310 [Condylostylus longicornis]
MLAKLPLLQSALVRNAAVMSRALYHHQGPYKHSTMDDLPVPQGDWQEDYQRKQTKYNAVLATGILMLVSAIGLAKSTGSIELNFSPPRLD